LTAAGVLAYGQSVLDSPTIIDFAGLAFFLAAFVFFAWFWLIRGIRECSICRIVPYFESRVGFGKIQAFSGGVELAKHCRTLDALASQLGATPLSAFGFKDDRDGQKLNWHNPLDGIDTTARLKEHIRGKQDAISIVQELDLLQNNLEQAREKNIKFCLLIRSGLDKMISPIEMDNRKGSFW